MLDVEQNVLRNSWIFWGIFLFFLEVNLFFGDYKDVFASYSYFYVDSSIRFFSEFLET